MNRKLLATAIFASLFAAGGAYAQSTTANPQDQNSNAQNTSGQSNQTTSNSKKPATLGTITVTGSLIPQSQIETANPTVTISAKDIEARGFGTVADVLKAMPLSTGAVQGNQFTNGFTPGAQVISLLGLDPGFTLVLINGHPLADYPLLYNGSSNFVDLSDIPVGMVDHIDVLPGNQSSIYGSSAIAGVINIILKDHINGYELNVRGGGYTGGGGANERLEFLGGYTGKRWDLTYGIQLKNQKPIFGYQRDLSQSTLANPDPYARYGSRTFLRLNGDTGKYVDPGQATCGPLSFLYGGTTDYETRPGHGNYCGSKYTVGYATQLNQQKFGTGYFNFKYHVNDNMEFYGDILYNISSIRYTSGPYFWGGMTPNSYIINANTGDFELYQHIFAPEEIGDWKLYSTHNLQRTYNAWVGLRGNFATSDWNYDVFFARSGQQLTQKQYWPLTSAVDNFFQNQFLGPELGTTYGYGIYAPNISNFYKPITPAQYATFNGLIDSRNTTWTQNLNFQLTNEDVFDLPAGPVGFAGLFQIGEQTWSNPNDPRVIAGDFYGLTGTSGQGARNNWAVAGEIRIPIFKMLTADLSARYDSYSNHGGGTDQRPTYKLGLEFRPFDTLLIRADYATAFRAPDMAYSFGGKSGFYTSVVDYYRCDKLEPGTPLQDCTYNGAQTFGLHTGNPDLSSITAKSYGFGVVWSPLHNFSVKADYYNIRIANEVQLQSIDELLRTEAACRLGQLDPSSPTCINTLGQIIRNGPTGNVGTSYELQQVTVHPINVANERVSGILASLNYQWDIGRYGTLGFDANYNVTLKHSFQQYPFDPVVDYLRDPFYSSEFKSKAIADISWDIGPISATLTGIRYGKTPNYYAQVNPTGYATPCSTGTKNDPYVSCAGTVAPWTTYNASVAYRINDAMTITGIVNNIKNSMPPSDPTWTSSPYYNIFNYNAYGRQYWLEFDWKFGQH